MSRIGKKPIAVPAGVKIQVSGLKINFEGPKGKHELTIHPRIKANISKEQIVLERPSDQKEDRSLHGLTRSLIQNAILGVSEGFMKKVEIEGKREECWWGAAVKRKEKREL